jgi:DNA-binding response OmpR family regulator
MTKILLLEDDEVLAESLIELLESEDFTILHAKDGQKALDLTYNQHFDMFLLDVNVPEIDGFELLKSLRESGDRTPAIFITALNDVASLACGFDVGADDYIKKPFDFDELLIRIHAILRKQYNSFNDEIKVRDFSFFIEKNELYKAKEFIPLAPYELKLTLLFFKNLDNTLSKEQIIDELYYEKEMSEGALRVHINKLRKVKLPIVTIKGIGYRLASS